MNKLQRLATVFQKPKTPQDLAALLDDLLTPEEVAAIDQRLDILSKLMEGKPQRDIAAELDCGIATVTRGSRILKHGTGATKKFLP